MTTLIKNVKVLAKDFSGFNDLNVLLSDDRIYDITSEISDADTFTPFLRIEASLFIP